MQTKYWVALILFCVLIELIGFGIASFNGYGTKMGLVVEYSEKLATLTAFLMLLSKGTLIRTVYFKWILLLSIGAIIGISFKLMHWPYANEILTLSILTIVGIYTVHFWKKPKKRFIDTFKWFWMVLFSTFKILVFCHWIPRGKGPMVFATGLFWVMVVIFVLLENRKQALNQNSLE